MASSTGLAVLRQAKTPTLDPKTPIFPTPFESLQKSSLNKGNWEKGLPMLARGSDEQLKAMSKKELQGAAASAEQVSLGDEWWNFAENQEGMVQKQVRGRAAYWYRQALPEVTGLVKDKVEKRLEKAIQLGMPSPNVMGKWLPIFRSSDPTVWNTDSSDEKRFAIPLARVPNNIRYLKMEADTRRLVVIAMTKDRLRVQSNKGQCGWEGGNGFAWGAHQLGIFDETRKATSGKAEICIGWKNNAGFSGWGFGWRGLVNDRQGYAWEGSEIAPTVFEISVTSDGLSPSERQHLLK